MKRLKVGLTGGIASGKSQVSQLFSNLGIHVIDADKIAKDLFKPGAELLIDLKTRFGEALFFSNGELNRKKLRNIVFNSAYDLAWLNQLTHPKITFTINQQLQLTKSPYVILDIPLLVDKSGTVPEHLRVMIDHILVIDIHRETQLKRLCNRDNLTTKEAESIINNQATQKQRLIFADDIIDNNATLDKLEAQVEALHHAYQAMCYNN